MANEKELNPSPKFPVGEKPELSPNPNFSDGLENKTSEKANTQIVNESKVQPIKNLTVQQIVELIQKYAPGFDPSSVQAGELVSALGLNADGLLKKQALAGMFDGKYVRIMDAPASDTLTDEQIAQIKEGVFIKGNFLNCKNPVLFPAFDPSGVGFIMGSYGESYGIIALYNILPNKKIEISNQFRMNVAGLSSIGGLSSLNGYVIPAKPSNTGTFTLKYVDGVLTWVADAE